MHNKKHEDAVSNTTSIEDLGVLSEDPDWYVRLGVVENRNTTKDIVTAMDIAEYKGTYCDVTVRAAIDKRLKEF